MTEALPFEGHEWQADPGTGLAVVHFVTAAKEFCWLLESEAALPQRDFIQQLLTTVLALYEAALPLPDVDPELDSREEPFFDQNSRQALRKQLAERLGGDVADPESHDLATLAGDLAGLYVAVKEGLLSIPEHAGQVPRHVIWNWTFDLRATRGSLPSAPSACSMSGA